MLNKTRMMQLSHIAYSDAQEIPRLVTQLDPDLSVVWGPAWKSSGVGTPYGLAFIVRSTATGAATVVIRGTDAWSLEAWFEQDFAIDSTVPFSSFDGGAPAEALLSKGAATGLAVLLDLVPNHRAPQVDMVSFLRSQPELKTLAVTGHSLGGTLTGPLFAALHAALAGLQRPPRMDLMSFAGLSPGNGIFADYLNTLTPSDDWRVENPLDIAPLLFAKLEPVLEVYGNYKPSLLDVGVLLGLFAVAATDYVQPGPMPTVLPAVPQRKASWLDQVVYQHHSSTYLRLVEMGD
jgi:hypothetical protein